MDIDIDIKTTFDPLSVFDQAINASMVKNGELKKHPCGIHFQNIPQDPITKLSAIPYKEASDLGYFKIDFLHLSVLEVFNNKQEIRTLLRTPPDWSLLKDPNVVKKLFHLSNWYDVLNSIEPKNIQELADCLALIRPLKQNLLPEYIRNKQRTRIKLYANEKGDKTSFKKSHAIAYALVIVLQLHLIKAGINV